MSTKMRRLPLGAALTLSLALPAQGQVFSAPVNVSQTPEFSVFPEIASDAQGNVNVVWREGNDDRDIFFGRSSDGATFAAPKNVSDSPERSDFHQIAVDGLGNINVVWVDRGDFILFSRSTDGVTFSEPVNLGLSVYSPARIALDDLGNINVAGIGGPAGASDVFHTRSTDGVSFSSGVSVSGTASVQSPRIAVDGEGNINVVWLQPFQVKFSRSTDEGQTFSVPMTLSSGFSLFPELAISPDGQINVLWTSSAAGFPQRFYIRFRRSVDGGVSFSPAVTLSSSNPSEQAHGPRVAVDGLGAINVVWKTSSSFNSRGIFFSRSTDGMSFSPSARLSSTNVGYLAEDPQIAIDNQGNTFLVYLGTDDFVGSGILLRRSTDGVNFSPILNFSGTPPGELAEAPRISVDGLQTVHIAWEGAFAGPSSDILYSRILSFSPTAGVQALLDAIGDLDLQAQFGGMLNGVLQTLEDMNENNDAAAIQGLESFVRLIEDERGVSISDSEAHWLLVQAKNTLALLSGW